MAVKFDFKTNFTIQRKTGVERVDSPRPEPLVGIKTVVFVVGLATLVLWLTLK